MRSISGAPAEGRQSLKRKVIQAGGSRSWILLIKKLYETYVGKLEEKRFEMLSTEYEKEQDELEQTPCQR